MLYLQFKDRCAFPLKILLKLTIDISNPQSVLTLRSVPKHCQLENDTAFSAPYKTFRSILKKHDA